MLGLLPLEHGVRLGVSDGGGEVNPGVLHLLGRGADEGLRGEVGVVPVGVLEEHLAVWAAQVDAFHLQFTR